MNGPRTLGEAVIAGWRDRGAALSLPSIAAPADPNRDRHRLGCHGAGGRTGQLYDRGTFGDVYRRDATVRHGATRLERQHTNAARHIGTTRHQSRTLKIAQDVHLATR